NNEARRTLGMTAYNLGLLFDKLHDRKAARKSFEESRQVRRGMGKRARKSSALLSGLVQTLTGLARGQEEKEKEASYVEAREMLEVALAGEQREYLADLARVEDHLGTLWRGENRLADAERAYVRALDLRARLAKEYPREVGYKGDLAGTCVNLAHV